MNMLSEEILGKGFVRPVVWMPFQWTLALFFYFQLLPSEVSFYPVAAFFYLGCSVEGSERQRRPNQPCSLTQQLLYLALDLCDFLL